jgi:lipoprotein-anchoring transpeptidase ErfK/SrfK
MVALSTATPASAFFFFRDDGTRYGSPMPSPTLTPDAARRKKSAMPKRARPLTPAEQGRQDEVLAKAKGRLLQAVITLDGQYLMLFADGEEIARSPVSTGTRSNPTPTGIFSVLEKRRHHRSNLYSNAPMPYMQRITWSGVALHQGVLPGYPASHGCIRLPESFARLMWSATKSGARVVIAREAVAPQAFAHPRLFTLKPKPAEPPPTVAPQAVADPVKVAEATTVATDAAPEMASPPAATDAPQAAPASPQPEAKPLKPGPITVFVSRKEQKLFVRKGFEPVFDAPVTIDNLGEPLGTHLFTAMAVPDDEGTLRWTALTMPPKAVAKPATAVAGKGRRPAGGRAMPISAEPAPAVVMPNPATALDRITIPAETLERVTELMTAGASFIVSDYGLGPETGKGTDFIVVTR